MGERAQHRFVGVGDVMLQQGGGAVMIVLADGVEEHLMALGDLLAVVEEPVFG